MPQVQHSIKLAQQGYDVNTCGDENLIFSSQWPLLKIYESGPFTISDVSQQQVIATHDLGFPAMFWVFNNVTPQFEYNGGASANANRSDFGNNQVVMSNSQLIWDPILYGLSTGTYQGYYYIFANDLTTQFTAPANNVGGLPAGVSPNRAFRIAKTGQSVHSTNLKDFVIHSDTRSPLIHSVNPGMVSQQPAGSYAFIVPHDLDYVPMFFGYGLNTDSTYSLLFTGSGGSTVFSADTNQVTFASGTAGAQLTIVILKDPFLVSYAVSVTV